MLCATTAGSSGRISVGCKSPLTGGQYMARLGYAGIIIEGQRRGDDLYKVVIKASGVTVEKCNELAMRSNYLCVAKLREEYGEGPGFVTIGTANEMRMCNSTFCFTDPEGRGTRHAGRGGVGAVMGSKGIKAIVLDLADTPVMRGMPKPSRTPASASPAGSE